MKYISLLLGYVKNDVDLSGVSYFSHGIDDNSTNSNAFKSLRNICKSS